jgi:transcriptional regulator with XRE-family HTH domain
MRELTETDHARLAWERGELADHFRRRRLRREFSVRALATRMGISPTHLVDLEHGRRQPSADVLLEWANVLGLDGTKLARAKVRADLKQTRAGRLFIDYVFGLELQAGYCKHRHGGMPNVASAE